MGDELFCVESSTLMTVEVNTFPDFSMGPPRKLFTGDEIGVPKSFGVEDFDPLYDVTPDGQRFVVVRNVDEGETPTITVVQNWIKEFQTP